MIKSEIASHLLVTVVSFIILTISSIASAETQGIATTKKVESILRKGFLYGDIKKAISSLEEEEE